MEKELDGIEDEEEKSDDEEKPVNFPLFLSYYSLEGRKTKEKGEETISFQYTRRTFPWIRFLRILSKLILFYIIINQIK